MGLKVTMLVLGEGMTDKLQFTAVTDEKGVTSVYSQWSFSDSVNVNVYKELSHEEVVNSWESRFK